MRSRAADRHHSAQLMLAQRIVGSFAESRGPVDLRKSLMRRVNIPEAPAWAAAAVLLLLSAYGGLAAVRPEGPPVTDIGHPAELLQESREVTAHGEAVLQAMRENDQGRVEQLKAEMQARYRRSAEREGKRAAAVTTARTWYGLITSLNFAVAVWLLIAARRSRPQ